MKNDYEVKTSTKRGGCMTELVKVSVLYFLCSYFIDAHQNDDKFRENKISALQKSTNVAFADRNVAVYNQAFRLATKLSDKNGDGQLDDLEAFELYRRADVKLFTYDANGGNVQSKFSLQDLEKVILSYKSN